MALAKNSSMDQINQLSAEEFVSLFSNVIEHCTVAAASVVKKRPFTKLENLINAFFQYLDELDDNRKINILKSHPNLGDKNRKEKLTVESNFEQNAAGMKTIDELELEILETYNKLYKEKFSFPFVICARENRVQSILTSIKMRLENSQSDEITAGIEEVKKIGKLRILDLVSLE